MNQLATANSTYLREHANQFIDWYEWGPEAFAAARQRDVPVFVSIGYSACHWCHVMSAETFADPAIAALLNERVVAIKVDREQHPLVDAAYVSAVQTMTGSAGWPLNVFVNHDATALYGGTYFPPQASGNLPSFSMVVEAVSDAWQHRREQLSAEGLRLRVALEQHVPGQPLQDSLADAGAAASTSSAGFAAASPGQRGVGSFAPKPPTAEVLLQEIWAAHDAEFGGFGKGAKFPPYPLLRLLLELPGATELALDTLETMLRTGLWDHVDFGIFRYTTDRAWSVPHFEKMLADQAQLLGVVAAALPCAEPHLAALLRRRLREGIGALRSQLALPGGLYGAARFAGRPSDYVHATGDTAVRPEEGAYYTVDLGEQLAAAAYGDAERSVLVRDLGLKNSAPMVVRDASGFLDADLDTEAEGQDVPWQHGAWLKIRAQLRAQREQDPLGQPPLDAVAVLAANASVATSLMKAGLRLGDTEIITLGLQQVAQVIECFQGADGTWAHSLFAPTKQQDARATGQATLSDLGHVLQALAAAETTRRLLGEYLASAKETANEALLATATTAAWSQLRACIRDGRLQEAAESLAPNVPTAAILETSEPGPIATVLEAISAFEQLEWDLPGAAEVAEAALSSAGDVLSAGAFAAPAYVAQLVAANAPALRLQIPRGLLNLADALTLAAALPARAGIVTEPQGDAIIVCHGTACSMPLRTAKEAVDYLQNTL